METIKKIIAANISYSGLTFNTPLLIEYKHTGVYYFFNSNRGKHQFSGIDTAKEYQQKGKKVQQSAGYYFISRLAIPTNYDTGTKTWWYINNADDTYKVNQVSKYAKKIHAELSKETINPLKA